jgi:hypothetical protein
MADEFFFMRGCEIKGAHVIFKKFKVNRHELQMLSCLSAYLQLKGRQATSRRNFLDWLGTSYHTTKKCEMYLDWLVKKGCLNVVTYKNKKIGHSLGLSVYGGNVLEAFYNEVERIELAHAGRKKMPGYKDLVFMSDSVPAGYSMNIAGRDN